MATGLANSVFAGFAGGLPSPANAQPVDELLIPVLIGRLDVIEQPATLADHLEQPSARMVVLAVRLEMFGQIGDALGQDGDLDLWRAGVAGLGRIFLDEILFALSDARYRSVLSFRGFCRAGPGCRPARSPQRRAKAAMAE